MVFVYIFLINSDAEHLFMYLLAICIGTYFNWWLNTEGVRCHWPTWDWPNILSARPGPSIPREEASPWPGLTQASSCLLLL